MGSIPRWRCLWLLTFHARAPAGHDFVIAGSTWLPWYTLFLTRTIRHCGWSNAILAALCFWFTLLSTWYYVPFLLILSGVLCLHHLLADRGQPHRGSFYARLLLLIGDLPVLWPVVAPIRSFDRHDLIQLSPDSLRKSSPDLLAFSIPSPDHFLFGHSVRVVRDNFLGDPTVQTVYLGYAVLFLACIAAFRAPNRRSHRGFGLRWFSLFWLWGLRFTSTAPVPSTSMKCASVSLCRLLCSDICLFCLIWGGQRPLASFRS